MPKVENGGAGAAKPDKKGMDKAKLAEIAKKEKEKKEAQKIKDKEKAQKIREKLAAAKEAQKAKAILAKAKEEERAAKKKEREARKAEKEAAKHKEPEWVTQIDEHGNEEKVDKNKFPFEVICAVCGSIRYVTKSGLLLVDKCKLHAKQARRKIRAGKIRAKVKKAKAIVADALAQGLFPEAFKKKHGLK